MPDHLNAWWAVSRLLSTSLTVTALIVDDPSTTVPSQARLTKFQNRLFGQLGSLPYYPMADTPLDILLAVPDALTAIIYVASELKARPGKFNI